MTFEIIAAYSIKGGVGKTSAAVNLAHLSSLDGASTLLWDLDPQGAATYTYRVQPKVRGGGKGLITDRHSSLAAIKATDYDRLDLLPADFSYRNFDLEFHDRKKSRQQIARIIEPIAKEYDRLILDCAPNLSLVSENIFHVADALVVPTIPTILSMRMLTTLMKHRRDHDEWQAEVLPFFSMVDRRKSMHRDACAAAREMGVGMLEAEIPYSSLVEQMALERKPITDFAPSSPPGRAYAALWDEVKQRQGSTVRRKRVKRLLEEMEHRATRPTPADDGNVTGSA